MSKTHYTISFLPFKRSCTAIEGSSLLECAARTGISINIPCSGLGTCGKCKIKIISGKADPTDADLRTFDKSEIKNGYRLACQLKISDNLIVYIPQTSLLAGKFQILTESTDVDPEVASPVTKTYIELAGPQHENNASDIELIKDKLGPIEVELEMLRRLPAILRKTGFKGTAVTIEGELVDFQEGDTSKLCYGAAFDIGTTTIVGKLIDLNTGKELSICSNINPQVAFGDDVLSRIEYSSRNAENLKEISEIIRLCINEMITDLAQNAGIPYRNIYEVCIAGNTTMEHLFCGISPQALGQVPFTPAFRGPLVISSKTLGLPINDKGRVYVFPIIGGFVGGDTVACILASRLWEEKQPVLLIDIGTNGEIVLINQGKISAASTAAGPALEGARLSCGTRAAAGAIDKVVFNSDIDINVIGDIEPRGICGSAAIDLIASLLNLGVVDQGGRLLAKDELPDTIPAAIRSRISLDQAGQTRFVIAKDYSGQNLYLTQKDVRELQLAIGAIRAGINIMLKKAGLQITDINKIYLAGGFGCYIRGENAQMCGLIPSLSSKQSIACIGNASLAGAKWALLSSDARVTAEVTARKVQHVELSQDMDFQMEFAAAMIFP